MVRIPSAELTAPLVVDPQSGDDGAVITSVETYALAVPLTKAIADSTVSLRSWIIPVVEIRTADGRVGTGISGVHCAPELLCDVVSGYYADVLLGAASDDILGTWKRLYWLPTHWIGRAGVVHMALSMVDIALWDLAAQRAGVPLWKMLGGTADAIETYNTDGGWLNLPVDTVIRDLISLIDSGWRRVKIKVGKSDWREDADRVRAVRRAIGDEVTLMCDANQRWDFGTANRLLPILEEVGMDWIEEPLHADDLEGHARLQKASTARNRCGRKSLLVSQLCKLHRRRRHPGRAGRCHPRRWRHRVVAGRTSCGWTRSPRRPTRRRHDAGPPAPGRNGADRDGTSCRVHPMDAGSVRSQERRARGVSRAIPRSGGVHRNTCRSSPDLADPRRRRRQHIGRKGPLRVASKASRRVTQVQTLRTTDKELEDEKERTGERHRCGHEPDAVQAELVRECDLDVVLVAGRYTLLDKSAMHDLVPCVERDVSIVVGGVFNSGVLIDPSPGALFDYVPASDDVLSRARRIHQVCRRYDVPMAAAAQFPLAHPQVCSVLLGPRSIAELETNLDLLQVDIPAELWADLDSHGLIRESAPTPA